MKREEARELLMQLIFQMGVQNDFSIELKDRFLKNYSIEKKQNGYISAVYQAVTDNLEYIDSVIETASNGWTTLRMPKTDLAICRVAMAEILYIDDIPAAVSVNEAVNLAKRFGTDNSQKFVNGLLGQAIKAINEK